MLDDNIGWGQPIFVQAPRVDLVAEYMEVSWQKGPLTPGTSGTARVHFYDWGNWSGAGAVTVGGEQRPLPILPH